MMIRMPRTTNENLHSIRGFRLALGSVRFSPVLRPLFSYRRHHHGDGAVQCAQGLLFAWRLFIRKLPFAVPHISGFRHARSEEHTSELQSQSNLVCRLLL